MIKYSISRDRDAGFENETKDCFVQALKHVTGVPYRDAHAFVAKHFNRVNGRGTSGVDGNMKGLDMTKQIVFGYRVFDKDAQPKGTTLRRTRRGYVRRYLYPTLTESMYRFRQGRFIVCSNNHAWAIIDGVVHDSGATKSGTRVTFAYEFVPSSQCEGR